MESPCSDDDCCGNPWPQLYRTVFEILTPEEYRLRAASGVETWRLSERVHRVGEELRTDFVSWLGSVNHRDEPKGGVPGVDYSDEAISEGWVAFEELIMEHGLKKYGEDWFYVEDYDEF